MANSSESDPTPPPLSSTSSSSPNTLSGLSGNAGNAAISPSTAHLDMPLVSDFTKPLVPTADYGARTGNELPDETSPLLGRPKPKPGHSRIRIGALRFYTIMAMLSIQAFVSSFDMTIMSTSHPVITSYFHASHLAPWPSTAFMLASVGLNPVVSALAEPIGRRRLLLLSGSIFLLGTLGCACAQSMIWFILARALCGVSIMGWLMLSAVLLADLVSIETRGTWQAIFNLTSGSGQAAGAALGGIMADRLGWRWEFGIQVPIILVLTLLSVIVPENIGAEDDEAPREKKSVRDAMRSFDYAGCFYISAACASLVLLANLGGNILPWSHPGVVITGIISVTTAFLFVRAEKTADKPVFPLELLGPAPFRYITGGSLLFALASNALYFNIPLYFQAVLRNTPTRSGLHLLVPTFVHMCCGIASCVAIRRWGNITPLIKTGPFCLVAAAASVFFFRSDWPEWAYLLAIAPLGAGGGTFFPSASLAAVSHTEQKDQPATAGITFLCRNLGTVLGIAFSGLVEQNALLHYLNEYVTDGPDKSEVVRRTHKSVAAIRELHGARLHQVVRSYEAAMRVTFGAIFVVALLVVPVVVAMRLKRIKKAS